MKGERERALAVLAGRKPDRIPWFGDLSYWLSYLRAEDALPDCYTGKGVYSFYRELGVGFYLQGYYPFVPSCDGVEVRTVRVEGKRKTTVVRTPIGELSSTEEYLADSYSWGTTEYLVKDPRDLRTLRYWYESMHYESDYDEAGKRLGLVGDDGLVLCYMPKSPLMQMITSFAGVESTIYALMDEPQEMEATFRVLEARADEAAAVAIASPAECLMIPENLSSEVVGKDLFRQYIEAYHKLWTGKIREAGKYSFIHMDGTLRGLLAEVGSVGFDALEALTPLPAGDLRLDELRPLMGDGSVLWGGLPGALFAPDVEDSFFEEYLIETLETMKCDPACVLGVADQVPPHANRDRIARVAELVDSYGRYDR